METATRPTAKQLNDQDLCAVCRTALNGGGSRSACGYWLCDECIAEEDDFADSLEEYDVY